MFRRLAPLLLPAFACGQAAKPGDPISPARPDFVETPQIVPVRSVGIEFGLTRGGRYGPNRPRTEFGEATFRFGLAPRTELRVDLPTYVLDDAHAARGWDDARVYGITYLGQPGGIDVGVEYALTLPAGTVGVGEGVVQPELYLLLKRETGGGAFVAALIGSTYARRDRADASAPRATITYRQPVGHRFNLFAEYAGFYGAQELPRHLAHFGVRFLVSANAAFDLHAGFGLGRGTEQGLLGAGYAVRF